MEAILSTRELNVGYDKKTVIRDVDIQAMKGQTICLIGPNGAGKSTILRTLTGMLAPVEGCVFIGSEDVNKMKANDKARRMAVVLTEKLSLNLTKASEVAAMGRTPYTGFFGKLDAEDKEIIESCLRTVGAWELKDRDYSSLSDGEKQKVLIARALAQTPELIVLDEPTSHLDIKHKIEVIRILNRLARETGLTVILALHDIDIAVKFCQVVLMVKDGRIVAQGRPEDIVRRDTLSSLYGIDGAYYDAVLGSIEICNEEKPQIFVAAGAGSGIPVYRMASRLGIGIATGILTENDIDCVIARDMRLTVIAGKSFEPITRELSHKAGSWIRKCRFLVDAGFPVGRENMENIRLLSRAARDGREILCLRAREECEKLYGGVENIRVLSSGAQLCEMLETGFMIQPDRLFDDKNSNIIKCFQEEEHETNGMEKEIFGSNTC